MSQQPARPIFARLGRRRLLIAGLALILTLIVFRAWRTAQPINDGTWFNIQKTHVLRIGMDASYPPFSDTPGGGAPVGLDVDLANEIGQQLGARVEIVNMGFDGLYDALITGQVDVLISALSIDPAHLGRVMYTRGYIDAGQVIVSRDGRYKHMTDLDGDTVAVEYGSMGDEIARIWQRRLHILKIAHFTTSDEALEAAAAGKADAALLDMVTARLYLRKHAGLTISKDYVSGDVYAVAARLVSYDLADTISKVLDEMEQDGTLAKIIDRWL